MNTAAEFLQASHRNRDFRRRPARVFRGTLSHHLQVAGFAAKQAAIEAGNDASPAKIAVKEGDVPTPNSHPHDPALAPDGALWYTGQESNTLGRLDPVTGKVREFQLKTPDSGPHGLVADRAGNIWFTANFKGYIGKLDPRTGYVTEYPLPDKGADDAHTPVFDQEGPFSTPTPIPCGGGVVRNMVATPDDKLYLAYRSVNKIGIAEILHQSAVI